MKIFKVMLCEWNLRRMSLIVAAVFIQLAAAHYHERRRPTPNYCAPGLCAGRKHIACGNNGHFGSRCPRNAQMISLQPYRSVLLHAHNGRRNLIASGAFAKFRPAKRMATMAWSGELAYLATLNVRACRMQHDQCRNTLEFHAAGQNLGFERWTGIDAGYRLNVRRAIHNLIGGFFAEHRQMKMPAIRKYHQMKNGTTYDHFALMVNDHNTHVGCAAVQFSRNSTTVEFVLACNYARMNIIAKPVYAVGPAAVGCRTGRHRKYHNLCSYNERYAYA